jgi:AraC-like DNA-binding protein
MAQADSGELQCRGGVEDPMPPAMRISYYGESGSPSQQLDGIAALSACRLHKVRENAFAYYPNLGRLAEYCKAHFQEDIGLQKAADIVNLERTYFCAYFHDKVGVCFSCWLAILRIESAKEHLQASNYPISTVADKVGLRTISTFERTFKRCTGMTASQYRKQVRPC